MTDDPRTSLDAAPIPEERRGTLGVGPDGEWQIRFQRRLRHPADRVWGTLIDPEQQQHWMPGVRIDATVGGAVVFDFGEEGKAEGEVLVVEPGRSLEHTWLWPGEPPSRVRWEISADGQGTVLVLLHRPLLQEPAIGYCAGWHGILDALENHVAGGEPLDSMSAYIKLFEFYSKILTAGS